MKEIIKISGKVIKGDGYGKVLGYPTANLDRRDYKRRKIKIIFGVYGGWAELVGNGRDRSLQRNRKYKAAIVIGPLDKKGLPKIEAHLLGFKGNLYGKYLNTYLNTYLRPFKKFKSEKELKKQIAKDINKLT